MLPTGVQTVRRIPWTSRDPPLVSLSNSCLCCPEDPLDIQGSSLHVPSDTGPHAVRRISWTSKDPPLVSFQTQAVYRIFQYYFLVLIRPKDFVVMITKYNNISQESRIFELAFFSTIVEVTSIQEIKYEMGSVRSGFFSCFRKTNLDN